MKEKIKSDFTTLFKSIFDTKVLFERRKKSFLFPCIIFILAVFMMIFPQYISSRRLNEDSIIKKFPQISAPMEKLLTSSLDCKVENSSLVCAEDAIEINTVVGDEIKYTIIANQKAFTTNTEAVYSTPKETDNIIILLSNYIKIRYCERDHVNEKLITYEIIGDYSELENYNFKEISHKLNSGSISATDEIKRFVASAYYSTLDTQLIVNFSSSLLSLLIFVLISSLIIKWPTIFKKKKGFTYSECLKISLTASFTALIFGTILHLFGGIEFFLSFALIYMIRILYIYFKYIYNSKNSIFIELYSQTKEERFKI